MTIRDKYNKVLKQLHLCTPNEKKALYTLLNYYYNKLN